MKGGVDADCLPISQGINGFLTALSNMLQSRRGAVIIWLAATKQGNPEA